MMMMILMMRVKMIDVVRIRDLRLVEVANEAQMRYETYVYVCLCLCTRLLDENCSSSKTSCQEILLYPRRCWHSTSEVASELIISLLSLSLS